MKLSEDYKNVCCVYKLTNLKNGKIMIGSTKNLYARINHYKYDINKENPLKHYNSVLYKDIIKYGTDDFEFEIVEKFNNITDIELKNKETNYIIHYKSNNPNIGYNIRLDIDGKCITSQATIELKRQQTKEQWDSGLRDEHSNKMKDYWNNVSNDRKEQQRNIMKRNLTKYVYTFYDANTNELIYDKITYEEVKKLGFGNINSAFSRNNSKNKTVSGSIIFEMPKNNFKVHYKSFIVERINVKN